MDGELTAIPSSTVEVVRGEGEKPRSPDSCREIFDKAFPAYLAIGMTYEEFYKKDHTLVIAYRKANELKRKKENEDFWLMGAYVYQAISRAAPLLIPFNQHPKAEPYLDKPIPIYEDSEETENAESRAVIDKGLAYMRAQMSKVNRKFGEV